MKYLLFALLIGMCGCKKQEPTAINVETEAGVSMDCAVIHGVRTCFAYLDLSVAHLRSEDGDRHAKHIFKYHWCEDVEPNESQFVKDYCNARRVASEARP